MAVIAFDRLAILAGSRAAALLVPQSLREARRRVFRARWRPP
jgi:hypothetical protein